jgi:hypothetical protein
MANLNKQQVWDAINNAPPGMRSDEVIDGLVAQGHQLEGYTPHQPQEQIAGMPVYNTPIGKIADWTVPVAKFIKENAVQPMQELGSDIQKAMPNNPASPLVGGIIKGTGKMLPETPEQVKFQMVAPILGEGLGKATGLTMKIPGIAEAVQALSKLPANLVEKVINTPEILNRYLPVDEAGEVMSKFFGQLGLKSGSEALEVSGINKAAPKLGDFSKIADNTVEAIKNQSQVIQTMNSLEQQAAQLNGKLQQINKVEQSMPGMDFSNSKLDLGNKLSDIKNQYIKLQDQLPNAQDALASRTYLSKVLKKQSMQAAEDQIVSPIASKNLNLVDNYLDNEVERLTTEAFKEGKTIKPIQVEGYGEITRPDQVRQIYHEAKIGDAFSSLFPQNRNGQVDSLRMLLGALSGNPAAVAVQSPLLWKGAIQSANLAASEGVGALGGSSISASSNMLSNLVTPQEEKK